MEKSNSILLSLVLSFLFVSILISTIPLTKAQDLVRGIGVSEEILEDTVAVELTHPARYKWIITNYNSFDEIFQILCFAPVDLNPNTYFKIDSKNSKVVEITFLPTERNKGTYDYTVYLKGDTVESIQRSLFLKVKPLSEILVIEFPTEISWEESKLLFKIRNKDNIDFGNATIFINSPVLKTSKQITIGPKQEQIVEIPFGDDLGIVTSGTYKFDAKLWLNNEYNYTAADTFIQLQEYSNIVEENTIQKGFFSYTKSYNRYNKGNTVKIVSIELKPNLWESLFNSYNIPPTLKPGYLEWTKELNPGESFKVEAQTNFFLFILLLIVIAIVVVGFVLWVNLRVGLKKRAFKIKTKGGHFATKIVIIFKNKGKEAKEIKLVDKIPFTTNLYEKFGSVKPDKIRKHEIEWNFPVLLPGEEIVVSYIVYSKIRLIGSLSLPKAILEYKDSKNRKNIVKSNSVVINTGN